MRKITQEEFDRIYEEHQIWIKSNGINSHKTILRNTDFTNIVFPSETNLSDANLSGANLSGANLSGANLSGAKFSRTILSGANLEGTNCERAFFRRALLQEARLRRANFRGANLDRVNFSRADLEEANLEGANLENADLEGANLYEANLKGANLEKTIIKGAILGKRKDTNDEKIIKEYQDKINKLENERIELITSAGDKETELKANKELLDKLRKEQKNLEEQFKKTIEENRIEDINKAFNTLINAGNDLKKEHFLLKCMFGFYTIGIVICASLLFYVWYRFYGKIESLTQTIENHKLEIMDIWVNIAPSFLLLGLIIFFIYQAHKCQRHMVILQKLLYKPMQIKGVLEAYFYMSGNNETTNKQINKVLDDYVSHIINHDVNTDKEETTMKNTDGKEKGLNEKVIDSVTNFIKELKGLV
ncbi:hypothetical protein D0T84_16260 [Dysgonomonas sp. 521]|uniref:pentapeptide repeat-containing protein n=1 Tax=Dysgonomonas sp. 521 TaxID=2302932 RepID=UPI0013D20270|nr:pentapeptide repeat-containing protein [Dysgonomonas sp. 521]NDV96455.1 hypothetical protein [Dysgonomonas sp. 521]